MIKKTEEKNSPAIRANDYLYFHRKKSNARRFFNYSEEREKKVAMCRKCFQEEHHLYVVTFFRIESTIHTHTQTQAQNSIVNWNIRDLVQMKLETRTNCSFVPLCSISFLDLIFIQRMHKHVIYCVIVPYCCIQLVKRRIKMCAIQVEK